MDKTADYYIKKLNLQKHPEGGAFREIYRSAESITSEALPERFGGDRSYSTSIYFLLQGEDISAFHKIKSDEIWHFYDGSGAKIYIISPDGELTTRIIGKEIEKEESFQVIIPHGTWFAAELINKERFILVGCTVSPGFDFHDFELAERSILTNKFPKHKELIERLTSNIKNAI